MSCEFCGHTQFYNLICMHEWRPFCFGVGFVLVCFGVLAHAQMQTCMKSTVSQLCACESHQKGVSVETLNPP